MAAKKDRFKGLFAPAQDDIRQQITIRRELKALIPSLADTEYDQLEVNIRAEGCREPLILWNDPATSEIVLIDGHNRHRICTQHGLPFDYVIKSFSDELAVRTWMINNQLGRRNLTPEQQSYLRGKRYEAEKAQGRRSDLTSTQNEYKSEAPENEKITAKHKPNTPERLAEEYNVSRATIQRDQEFALGVDRLAEANPDLKDQILTGQLKVNKGAIQTLSRTEPGTLPAVGSGKQITIMAKAVKEGKDVKAALQQLRDSAPKHDSAATERQAYQRRILEKVRRLENLHLLAKLEQQLDFMIQKQ